MTSSDWDELERAFHAAMALDGTAREDFVAAFAKDNPAQADALRRLVQADERDDDALREPIASAAQSLAEEASDVWIGRSIGPWRIVRRLASGGMGAVFVGERADEEYAQTVAIKLMAAQLVSPNAIARFRSERQILANLQHKYIAQLVDGGTTDEGLPYLVMEYVDGLPIDEYCDRHRLGIAERLSLFCKVCEAVDYAHRNLVVHRDLKPSNILVDAHGEPKLLDFGIAKLLDADAYDTTMAVTRIGGRVMTPEFASPEQVRGQPVSIASDVYSLGVLLFRLMTGHSPYGDSGTGSGEIARAILETDPKRPSTVVQTPTTSFADASAGSPESVGEKRSMSPDRLRKRLSGDVDNIVLMSLQKEPERRYNTAMALADDIHRHLNSEPIAARGRDWLYTSSRFVRRNVRALALTSLAIVILAGVIAFSALRITAERDLAERERRAADRERATAERVSTFLQDIFAQADPGAGSGDKVTAREILESGARRVETDLADEPAVQIRLLRVIGNAYLGLSMVDESRAMLDAALARAEALYEPDHDEVLETRSRLSDALWWDDDGMEKTLALRSEVFEAYRAKYGPDDAKTIEAENLLIFPLFVAGRIDEAKAVGERVLAYARESAPDPSAERAGYLNNIADLKLRTGDYHAAIALAEEALAQYEAAGTTSTGAHWSAMVNIAEARRQFGHYDEAIDIYEDLLESQIRAYGEGRYTVGVTEHNLALLLKEVERYDEAEQRFRSAIDTWSGLIGDNQRDVLIGQTNYAALLGDMERYDEAEQVLLDVNRRAPSALGADNPELAFYAEELAMVHQGQGRLDDAEAGVRKALAIREVSLGFDHPITARNVANLGRLLMKKGELDAAERYLRQSLEIRERIMQPGDIDIAESKWSLGEVLNRKGEFAEAEAHLAQALLGFTDSYGENHDYVRRIRTALDVARNGVR